MVDVVYVQAHLGNQMTRNCIIVEGMVLISFSNKHG